MSERSYPEDLDAERSLLGTMLRSPTCVPDVLTLVGPDDFYKPGHGHVFDAIATLHRSGDKVSATGVREAMQLAGTFEAAGGATSLAELVGCGDGAWRPAARLVVRAKARRSLIEAADHAIQGGFDPSTDIAEVVEGLQASLSGISMPGGRLPSDLMELDTLLDAPEQDRAPWVVPGLLRRDWRVIVVAPEGAGKTLLLQQIAVCAAQGVHPLTFESVPSVRVLIIDLENPEERIAVGCTPIRAEVRKKVTDGYDSRRAMLWHRPGGIDLRSRANVAELEAVLEKVRPELVVMGPAYKASTRHKGEGWDEGAAAVQRVLDSLRTRFGFALLMEDHAPQSSNGVRDLRPFGSSLWLRWPEIGIKLAPDAEPPAARTMDLKRWRGDRLPNGWPERLEESATWPWIGVWKDRMPTYGSEAA